MSNPEVPKIYYDFLKVRQGFCWSKVGAKIVTFSDKHEKVQETIVRYFFASPHPPFTLISYGLSSQPPYWYDVICE